MTDYFIPIISTWDTVVRNHKIKSWYKQINYECSNQYIKLAHYNLNDKLKKKPPISQKFNFPKWKMASVNQHKKANDPTGNHGPII